MTLRKLILTVFVASFVAVGCGGGGNSNPVAPAVTPPPTFSMASLNVTCNDGTDCIQFSTRPSKDVVLIKVVITNPSGTEVTFNLGSATVVADQNVALQDPNFAYFRIGGTWKFVFTGNLATGEKTSFEVTSTLSVSS